MPHENTWERQGVVKRFWGYVSAEEFVQSAHEIAADVRFDDLRFIINDFLAIEGLEIDRHALEQIAALRFGSMLTNPDFRVALVSTSPQAAALAEATKAPPFNHLYETRAFPTMDLARDWLASLPVLNKYCRPLD